MSWQLKNNPAKAEATKIELMKFQVATIKDIAKELGLSASTISRALHDSHEISIKTKEKVVAYAKQVNYQPNPAAVSLKERKNNTIGLIVSEIANSYYSQVVNGIESVARENGFNVLIAQSFESFEKELVNLKFLTSRSVDGLILSVAMQTRDFSYLQYLRKRGMPIVFFDRIVEEIEGHRVTIDNYKGAYEAITYLIGKNYKRIAVINSNQEVSITQERMSGYLAALSDHGIEVNESLIKYCPKGGIDFDEVQNAVAELLALSERPDVIFTTADRPTMHCLRILNQFNIKIPEEIGLIGFSNSDQSDLFYPPLSVIKQPAFEMGARATTLLLNWIESKRPVTHFSSETLPSQLIIRKSVR